MKLKSIIGTLTIASACCCFLGGFTLAASKDLAVGPVDKRQSSEYKWPHIEQSQKNRTERTKWWRDAKFGMFIHWGLYAIPAGIWKGKEYDGIGEWIMSHADIGVEEYGKLADQFNPTKFDARQWVQIAKEAGMKYIVITSKHHDGFCMFDSKVTDYDIVDATPYGKDVLKALNTECKKAGIKFCTYYSILDWHHPAQMLKEKQGRHIYGRNLIKPGRKQEYKDYVKAQLCELVRQYDPALLWFDGGWMDWWKGEDGIEIVEYLWSISPDIIINNRATGKTEEFIADYSTPEQRIPKGRAERLFETCMTMNDTWGYKKNDQNWKSAKTLIVNLVDIVSKGGNYLLNVGPTAEGLIPEPSVVRLKKMGRWLKVNGEAIYATGTWKVYKQDPKETDNNASQDEVDIRFTRRGDFVYAACLDWPEGPVEIRSLGRDSIGGRKIREVVMLGSREKLRWNMTGESLSVIPPKRKPCKYVYVFRIKLE